MPMQTIDNNGTVSPMPRLTSPSRWCSSTYFIFYYEKGMCIHMQTRLHIYSHCSVEKQVALYVSCKWSLITDKFIWL